MAWFKDRTPTLGRMPAGAVEMTDNKKSWIEPELIVLVRNKPEEAVLTGCKTSGTGLSRNDRFDNCYTRDGTCFPCDADTNS